MTTRGLVVALLAAATFAAPAAAQQSEPGARVMVTGTDESGLQLRAGAGFDEKSVGALAEGTVVQVLDGPVRAGRTDWYLVQPPASLGIPAGYASAAYLAPATAEGGAGARVMLATVTGYANGADGGSVGSMTASGAVTHWGTVAADWRLFPLGTRLQIDGFPDVVFIVEDSGSGVRGDLIDIWFPDLADARAFGTQRRQVTVLSNH